MSIPECIFSDGDGVGGTDRDAGLADTHKKCAVLVRSAYPAANGVTYAGNGSCYARFGVTANNGNVGWQSCIFPCKKLPLLNL